MFYTTCEGKTYGTMHVGLSSDNFLRRDGLRTLRKDAGAADDGSHWTATEGDWRVANTLYQKYNYVYQIENAAEVYLFDTSDDDYDDFTLSCDILTVEPDDATNNHVCGIIFNYVDATHYWKVYIKQDDYLQVNKRTGGAETAVKSVATAYDTKVWNNLLLKIDSDNLYVYVNGINYISETSVADLADAKGKIGLMCAKATGQFGNYGLYYSTKSSYVGSTWFRFNPEVYNVTEDVPINRIKIPGRVGSVVQSGTPHGRTWHFEGNITQDTASYSDGDPLIHPRYGVRDNLRCVDTLMRKMVYNHYSLWFDTPMGRGAGVMMNPQYPVFVPGTGGKAARIAFDIVEYWDNGLDD